MNIKSGNTGLYRLMLLSVLAFTGNKILLAMNEGECPTTGAEPANASSPRRIRVTDSTTANLTAEAITQHNVDAFRQCIESWATHNQRRFDVLLPGANRWLKWGQHIEQWANASCVLCSEPLMDTSTLHSYVAFPCNDKKAPHIFHRKCIASSQRSCPTCQHTTSAEEFSSVLDSKTQRYIALLGRAKEALELKNMNDPKPPPETIQELEADLAALTLDAACAPGQEVAAPNWHPFTFVSRVVIATLTHTLNQSPAHAAGILSKAEDAIAKQQHSQQCKLSTPGEILAVLADLAKPWDTATKMAILAFFTSLNAQGHHAIHSALSSPETTGTYLSIFERLAGESSDEQIIAAIFGHFAALDEQTRSYLHSHLGDATIASSYLHLLTNLAASKDDRLKSAVLNLVEELSSQAQKLIRSCLGNINVTYAYLDLLTNLVTTGDTQLQERTLEHFHTIEKYLHSDPQPRHRFFLQLAASSAEPLKARAFLHFADAESRESRGLNGLALDTPNTCVTLLANALASTDARLKQEVFACIDTLSLEAWRAFHTTLVSDGLAAARNYLRLFVNLSASPFVTTPCRVWHYMKQLESNGDFFATLASSVQHDETCKSLLDQCMKNFTAETGLDAAAAEEFQCWAQALKTTTPVRWLFMEGCWYKLQNSRPSDE